MINGSPSIKQDLADYDQHLLAHIKLLETAIKDSTDPKEREKGRATIRRLRTGMGTLKK